MQPTEASRRSVSISGSARLQLRIGIVESRTRRRLVQGAHEDITGFTDQGIEQRRWLPLDHFFHNVIDRGLAELEQALGQNASAGAGRRFPGSPGWFPRSRHSWSRCRTRRSQCDRACAAPTERPCGSARRRHRRRCRCSQNPRSAPDARAVARCARRSGSPACARPRCSSRRCERPAPHGSDRRKPCDRRQPRRRDRADAAQTESRTRRSRLTSSTAISALFSISRAIMA